MRRKGGRGTTDRRRPAFAGSACNQPVRYDSSAIPCFVRYTRCYFKSGRRLPAPDREGIDAVLPEVTRYFGVLEQRVIQPTGLVRGNFSLADLALLPILDYLAALDETRPFLTDTRLAAYYMAQRYRPSFAATASLPQTVDQIHVDRFGY
jgi:glutathione S-transferase